MRITLDDVPPTVRQKMNPRTYRDCSPMFIAILGWLVADPITEPAIEYIMVTSDDFVLAQTAGDCGCNQFIGAWRDFERNVLGAARAAELSEPDLTWVKQQLALLYASAAPNGQQAYKKKKKEVADA